MFPIENAMLTFESMKEEKPVNSYLKYSTMGFEMGITIAIGAGLGYLADKQFGWHPYGKAFGSLLFVIIAIYRVVKDFIKPKQ